ncbi:MAG: hypothetical protein NT149_04940 [Candidatus Gottesmanbacteria bacterium]|nr:hypothetical protein [Candidatus Gottesmanbacteria bacterium]
MTAKQELTFENEDQQHEYDLGVEFLQQHHLRVIPKEGLIRGKKAPYIMVTDENPFDLKYYEGSAISTGCIFEAHKDPQLAMQTLVRMLGSYQRYVDSGLQFVYRLPANEPMTVVLHSPGWEQALKLVEDRFPGTVGWAVKPAK